MHPLGVHEANQGKGINFPDAPDFRFSASKLENQKGLVSSVCDFLCDFEGVSGYHLKIGHNPSRSFIYAILRVINVTQRNSEKPPENKS